MSATTSIEWTDRSWNPIRGCSVVSEGCKNCYAMKVAARFSGPGLAYEGLALQKPARWTGVVRVIDGDLDAPSHWRKPCRIFVNSMSDLFHESLSDEDIERVFGVMALAPQHTFQVLTKRTDRMLAWFAAIGPLGTTREQHVLDAASFRGQKVYGEDGAPFAFDSRGSLPHLYMNGSYGAKSNVRNRRVWPGWPLPNVWLGTSVENQETADERIPHLLATPAAVRFLSVEPLLGPIRIDREWLGEERNEHCSGCIGGPGGIADCPGHYVGGVDWVIVGGESGPNARPCDVAWIRSIVEQCREAGVACFVKQMGSVWARSKEIRLGRLGSWGDTKGHEMPHWPADLRVREYPVPA